MTVAWIATSTDTKVSTIPSSTRFLPAMDGHFTYPIGLAWRRDADTSSAGLQRQYAGVARLAGRFKEEVTMKIVLAVVGLTGVLLMTCAAATAEPAKPTIVLVHGAFADASSWNGVVAILESDGYPVVAVANPLRSVPGDAGNVRALLTTITTPVVLVGHSYGGMVISDAATGQANVKALVYVAAFAPVAGETAGGLDSKFPGSLLGPATLAPPVPLPGGGNDLYIRQDRFHEAFAPDLSEWDARLAAATQRPITDTAFGNPALAPAWKAISSWFVYGDNDTAIPPKLHALMAERAHARETVVVSGASHVVMISHPAAVAKVIEDAAIAH